MDKWKNLKTTVLAIVLFLDSISGIPDIIHNIDTAFAYPLIKFPQIVTFRNSYDFIIIGCGTSGSLLANRLTEVSSFEVLCIEAGHEENAAADIIANAPKLVQTEYAWDYKTTYQEGLCGGFVDKLCDWPRGKALGGTSVINYGMYTRANSQNFDTWAKDGNDGWSFKDVSKYYKKFENYTKIKLDDPTLHGFDGELNIENPGYETPTIPYILQSAIELGLPQRDINGRRQIGISRIQAMLRDGRRLSAAHAFLLPIRNRPNLHVAKNSFVKKIIIDPHSKTAKGVVVSVFNVTHTVWATKEVILSAGAISSPQILMLSGVGPKAHLDEFNIQVLKDLPVGKNLKDHVRFSSLIFLVDEPMPPRDPFPNIDYVFFGKGPSTVPVGTEAVAFFNTRSYSNDNDVPDMELLVVGLEDGSVEKFGEAQGYNKETYNDIFSSVNGRAGFAIMPVVQNPSSTGYLELKSTDPFVHPKLFSNYFEDDADVDTLLRGVRQAIRIGTGKPLQKFKPKLHEFRLKPCAKHQFNSNSFWKCAFKFLPNSLFHLAGTCKMGPLNEEGTVVDPELRVQGIKKLRVVDASIMPRIPSAHLTATCYVIAEKAADMIKKTYGVI